MNMSRQSLSTVRLLLRTRKGLTRVVGKLCAFLTLVNAKQSQIYADVEYLVFQDLIAKRI